MPCCLYKGHRGAMGEGQSCFTFERPTLTINHFALHELTRLDSEVFGGFDAPCSTFCVVSELQNEMQKD